MTVSLTVCHYDTVSGMFFLFTVCNLHQQESTTPMGSRHVSTSKEVPEVKILNDEDSSIFLRQSDYQRHNIQLNSVSADISIHASSVTTAVEKTLEEVDCFRCSLLVTFAVATKVLKSLAQASCVFMAASPRANCVCPAQNFPTTKREARMLCSDSMHSARVISRTRTPGETSETVRPRLSMKSLSHEVNRDEAVLEGLTKANAGENNNT